MATAPLRSGLAEIDLLGFLSERNKEFVRRDSGLLEDTAKGADLYLAMVRHNAP